MINDIKHVVPQLYKEKEDCCGCTACCAICPQQAVTMEVDDEGFCYPVIKESQCINCKMCIKVCPFIDEN